MRLQSWIKIAIPLPQWSEPAMICVGVVSTGMPFEHGGAELRALRHVQYIRRQTGFDALLIAWDQGEEETSALVLPEYVYPVRVKSSETKTGQLSILLHLGDLFIRLGWRMFSLRKRMDVVHIIFAFSWFNLLAVALAKWLGKPVVLEMTALETDDPLTLNRRAGHPEYQMFPHRPLKYRLFKMADIYISKSTPLSDAYRQSGLPKAKLYQIGSAVDQSMFRPLDNSEEKLALQRKLGLEAAETIIVYSGRLNEHKGLHWLMQAFQKLVPVYPAVKLLFVGAAMRMDEAYARALREAVVPMGLSERIVFTGRVDNVQEYLQASDIFAIPTEREGLSGSILEAMSCGLPVVASDIPEISLSQITNGVEGLLTPMGNVERLSEALIALVRDRELRQRLGAAARQRVLREFTPDVIGSKYMEIYKQLISSGHQHDSTN
jgi:glycosyltransferase involved in cell wall biosynthesis